MINWFKKLYLFSMQDFHRRISMRHGKDAQKYAAKGNHEKEKAMWDMGYKHFEKACKYSHRLTKLIRTSNK